MNDSNLWQVKLDPRTGKPVGQAGSDHELGWLFLCFCHGYRRRKASSVFLKLNFQSNVYIAELEAGGARLSTPRRLTLDDRNDCPAAWTSDSAGVLFWSDRNGPNQIFKQKIDEHTAETVIAGPDQAWMPRVSPDGKSILYSTSPEGLNRLFAYVSCGCRFERRNPTACNGRPRLANFACPRAPAEFCLVAQSSEDGKKLMFTAFHPIAGQRSEVLTLDVQRGELSTGCHRPMVRASLSRTTVPLQGRIRRYP